MADAASRQGRRLGVLSLGFLRQPWLRIALAAQRWQVVPGWRECDAIGVWGRGPVAERGIRLARRRGLPVITIEDAFLRSVRPGDGPAAGLILDDLGVHYDPSDSRAERILSGAPASDPDTDAAMALLRHHRLSKYNDWPATADTLPARFTLVVDQVAGDAALMGAGRAEFDRMLATAIEGSSAPVFVRPHPAGIGLLPRDLPQGARWMPSGINPWDLWMRAEQIHVHSSQLGLEAVLAGRSPTVHGRPIYAGWGLTDDRSPMPGRIARLQREQLFAGLYRDLCQWHDPATGAVEDLLRAVSRLASTSSAHARTRGTTRLSHVSRWKRARVADFLGREGGRTQVAWGAVSTADARIEDGFLRSRGLGARLVPPVSLSHDTEGIHYDPSRSSTLERMIAASVALPPAARHRAEALRVRIVAGGISKYNLGAVPQTLPEGRRILIAGQVPGDASVRLGGSGLGDAGLIAAARAAHPDAVIVYRPHPDLVAGLRSGIPASGADHVVKHGDITALFEEIDGLWTETSLAGFEALLRGVAVTCTGWPFYAGWGLTFDRGSPPAGLAARRTARPDITALVLDNSLPDGRGVDFALEQARGPAFARLSKIMVTDLPSPFMWEKARAAGITEVVIKADLDAEAVRRVFAGPHRQTRPISRSGGT